MMDDIKDDIFEAIRECEPNNPFLRMKYAFGGRLSPCDFMAETTLERE